MIGQSGLVGAAAEGVFGPVTVVAEDLEARREALPLKPSIETPAHDFTPTGSRQFGVWINMVDCQKDGFFNAAATASQAAVGRDGFKAGLLSAVFPAFLAPGIDSLFALDEDAVKLADYRDLGAMAASSVSAGEWQLQTRPCRPSSVAAPSDRLTAGMADSAVAEAGASRKFNEGFE